LPGVVVTPCNSVNIMLAETFFNQTII
jgi:hypothetical protein